MDIMYFNLLTSKLLEISIFMFIIVCRYLFVCSFLLHIHLFPSLDIWYYSGCRCATHAMKDFCFEFLSPCSLRLHQNSHLLHLPNFIPRTACCKWNIMQISCCISRKKIYFLCDIIFIILWVKNFNVCVIVQGSTNCIT